LAGRCARLRPRRIPRLQRGVLIDLSNRPYALAREISLHLSNVKPRADGKGPKGLGKGELNLPFAVDGESTIVQFHNPRRAGLDRVAVPAIAIILAAVNAVKCNLGCRTGKPGILVDDCLSIVIQNHILRVKLTNREDVLMVFELLGLLVEYVARNK
jgi:hypothetical protein